MLNSFASFKKEVHQTDQNHWSFSALRARILWSLAHILSYDCSKYGINFV